MAAGLFLVSLAVVAADGEVWEENDHEVLIRNERGAKNKGTWTFLSTLALSDRSETLDHR